MSPIRLVILIVIHFHERRIFPSKGPYVENLELCVPCDGIYGSPVFTFVPSNGILAAYSRMSGQTHKQERDDGQAGM